MLKKNAASRMGLLGGMFCAGAMAFSTSAYAQSVEKEAEPPADAPSPEDSSILTVSDAEANASAADAKTALLEAQIAGLQAQLDDLKKVMPKALPTWKGAPQWEDKDAGFSFKVRGRLMLDAAYAGKPDNYVANRNLGFNARVRRFRIGVEGALPAGFGYKAEVDYANGAVGFGDVILTYAPANKPFSATLGNHESLNGMEQQSSSRWSSFIERAQGNDAFGNTRRLGASFGYKSSDNFFRIDAGLFTAHSIDASVDNDGWIGAARATYAAPALGGLIHVGANYQHREFQSNNSGGTSVSTGAPSTNQIARYRARPFLQTTDVRFVDTGNFAAKGDDIFGVEAYGIFKSLHLGGEWQYVKVDSYRPGNIRTGLDAFAGTTSPSTGVTVSTPNATSYVAPFSDPSFFSGHFEVGYFLTGETRGYKNGLWDRTKVLNPFDKGGWGAIQVTGRFDYLDLDSSSLKDARSNNFGTGVNTLGSFATRAARGGKQTGYLLGVTWIPTDYVRFLVNYIHTEVEGGAFAGIAQPTSTLGIDRRKYSTDAFAVRAQFDF
jgi:phosphate-selective porin OprO and OprP